MIDYDLDNLTSDLMDQAEDYLRDYAEDAASRAVDAVAGKINQAEEAIEEVYDNAVQEAENFLNEQSQNLQNAIGNYTPTASNVVESATLWANPEFVIPYVETQILPPQDELSQEHSDVQMPTTPRVVEQPSEDVHREQEAATQSVSTAAPTTSSESEPDFSAVRLTKLSNSQDKSVNPYNLAAVPLMYSVSYANGSPNLAAAFTTRARLEQSNPYRFDSPKPELLPANPQVLLPQFGSDSSNGAEVAHYSYIPSFYENDFSEDVNIPFENVVFYQMANFSASQESTQTQASETSQNDDSSSEQTLASQNVTFADSSNFTTSASAQTAEASLPADRLDLAALYTFADDDSSQFQWSPVEQEIVFASARRYSTESLPNQNVAFAHNVDTENRVENTSVTSSNFSQEQRLSFATLRSANEQVEGFAPRFQNLQFEAEGFKAPYAFQGFSFAQNPDQRAPDFAQAAATMQGAQQSFANTKAKSQLHDEADVDAVVENLFAKSQSVHSANEDGLTDHNQHGEPDHQAYADVKKPLSSSEKSDQVSDETFYPREASVFVAV